MVNKFESDETGSPDLISMPPSGDNRERLRWGQNKMNPESQGWASVQQVSNWRRISSIDVENAGIWASWCCNEYVRASWAERLRIDDPGNLIQVLQNVGLVENRREKRRA